MAVWWWKPLIFQTYTIWSNIIHSLKYLRSTTSGCKDIGNRKSELLPNTQFLLVITYLILETKVISFLSKYVHYIWCIHYTQFKFIVISWNLVNIIKKFQWLKKMQKIKAFFNYLLVFCEQDFLKLKLNF